MNTQKNILILHRHSPYSSCYPQEALDMALMFTAFNQQVSLAFLDDGVWQLLKEQDSAAINKKSLAVMYQALEIYDIKNIFVEAESMAQRHLNITDFALPVMLLTSAELRQLQQQQDVLLNW